MKLLIEQHFFKLFYYSSQENYLARPYNTTDAVECYLAISYEERRKDGSNNTTFDEAENVWNISENTMLLPGRIVKRRATWEVRAIQIWQCTEMGFWLLREKAFRQKRITHGSLETQLRRCLTTTDITLLGIGHMIGAGIYVLTALESVPLVTGSVVRNTAGPSIVLSFLLAGVASLLSALCYAEFGARFPKAGSAYTYAYVGVGELWAFIIGWNIILEHMLGSAAVARSWSGYLDSLVGNVIFNNSVQQIGRVEKSSFFGDYFDFVAFVLIVVVAIFVALGSRTSTNINSFLTVLNMIVIVIVVGYGITFADFSLWSGVDNEGRSRFFPYGVKGMLTGAASCFFAFIGFDGLATAGEEAKKVVLDQ
ncbi:high affinity cationic amino acid transporter 1 domain protein [Dictyocaulus viviparus]|uniref:High affinity cationic amino acid transporter 1 domain protein n=1 Tax=Dictyocaulus viviparus TaxID=29172 RepID=A0A0D8XSX1_DICVI|nr:high affinity cationic amino acid transporter 1 domain protein [Dictyocaulus viviparus]